MSEPETPHRRNRGRLAIGGIVALGALGVVLVAMDGLGVPSTPEASRLVGNLGYCCIAACVGGVALWQLVKRVW
jgi:hypothetical protein